MTQNHPLVFLKTQNAVGNSLGAGAAINYLDMLNRAQALTCAGCHQLSNGAPLGGGLGNWPNSLDFVHTSESELESDPANSAIPAIPKSFKISDALKNVFLPHRKCVIEAFINAEVTACK